MGTVVVVTNIPRPYRQALFAVLKNRLAADDCPLRVLYTSNPSKHVRRGSVPIAPDDMSMESYVHNLSLRMGYERVVSIPLSLGHSLKEMCPSCVVVPGFGPVPAMAAHWCRKCNVPYVIWSGAWSGNDIGIGRMQLKVREGLVRHAAAFIAYGSAAADYLVALGAHRARIFSAWNTVDIESLAAAAHAAASRRSDLVDKYRLANRNLLYVGSVVESKGVAELVSAALTVDVPGVDWALHFVGAGPLEEALKTRVLAAGKDARFRFHGLRPPADVAELLGVVDGFVLPTKLEAWGLVINEAMACGVPVVVSTMAGATRDLVENGISGYVVDPSDTSALSQIMSRLVVRDPRCREVGIAGARAVREKASLEKAAEGFIAAVKCAMTRVGQ